MFIIDAHLDLSMNALEWNRDLRQPVHAIRKRETGLTDKPDRAKGTVALPELRAGNIGLVVATQIARYVAPGNPLPGWHSPHQAWAQSQGQLAWYKAMEDAGEMVMIKNKIDLDTIISLCGRMDSPTIKNLLAICSVSKVQTVLLHSITWKLPGTMVCAPSALHIMVPAGMRMVPMLPAILLQKSRALIKEIERLGLILDATHLCDDAFSDAMEIFNGNVWASHNNVRALVDHNRQFSDDMIRTLISKGAVIGAALDAWMMVPNWVRQQSTPESMQCNLEVIIDHIDHICQLAGNSLHAGIGTDLDGAFGKEQCPYDLETIADLQKLPEMFSRRGYSAEAIQNIMHGNFLRFMRNALPE